jgi:alpha-1,2-mannosyltransferase
LLRLIILVTQYISFAIGLAIIWRLHQMRLGYHVRVAIAAGLSVLIASFNLIASDPADLFGDFKDAYYPAGVAVLNDPQSISTLFDGVLGFVNMPIVAYIFTPFAALPIGPASVIFAIAGLVMAAAACVIIAREAGLDEPRSLLFMFVFSAFGPLAYSIKEGNTSHMILLALAVGLALLRTGRNLSAGLLLGLAAIIKLPLMLFGVYFVLRRNWRAALGFGLICAGTGLASLAIFGWDMHQRWFDECIRNFNANAIGAFNVQSFAAFLIRLVEPAQVLLDWNAYPPGPLQKAIATSVVIAIYLAAIAACARGGPSSSRGTGGKDTQTLLDFQIVLGLSVLTSPLSWSHYFVWLLMPIGILLGPVKSLAGNAPARGLVWVAILLMMPIVFMLQFPWAWMNLLYAKLLVSHLLAGGLIILALLIWARWQESSAAEPIGERAEHAAG